MMHNGQTNKRLLEGLNKLHRATKQVISIKMYSVKIDQKHKFTSLKATMCNAGSNIKDQYL